MYTMSFDPTFIIFIIVGLISVATKYKEEQSKKEKAAPRQKSKRMTPADILDKLNKIKEESYQKPKESLVTEQEPATLSRERRKKNISQQTATEKTTKKRRVHHDEPAAAESDLSEPDESFSREDWRRAILTKEILDKPKALRNDLY
jgi:hypothetical protein